MKTIPLFDGCDPKDPVDQLVAYHLGQAFLDWRADNYPTIGVALSARLGAALEQAAHDSLSLDRLSSVWFVATQWLRHDSGIDFAPKQSR